MSGFNFAEKETVVDITAKNSKGKTVTLTHTISTPTPEQEFTRERMSPQITRQAGKIDGGNAVETEFNDSGLLWLYSQVAKKVSGYRVKGVVEPEGGFDYKAEVEGKKISDIIPTSHKLAVVASLANSVFEVPEEEDTDEDFFSIGGDTEYKVRQLMGGRQPQEDGSLSAPDFTIDYTFREPSEKQLRKIRNSIVDHDIAQANGANYSRRVIKLPQLCATFDELLKSVEGAHINGTAVNPSDSSHLEAINPQFKKGAVLRLFTFLQAELGK